MYAYLVLKSSEFTAVSRVSLKKCTEVICKHLYPESNKENFKSGIELNHKVKLIDISLFEK